jgi:hypothetical protein
VCGRGAGGAGDAGRAVAHDVQGPQPRPGAARVQPCGGTNAPPPAPAPNAPRPPPPANALSPGNWCAAAALDDDLLDLPGYRPQTGWMPATGTGIAPDIHPPHRRHRENRP